MKPALKKLPSRIEKRGRKTDDPKPITLCFRMGPADVERLDRLADADGSDRSTVVRNLIAIAHTKIHPGK